MIGTQNVTPRSQSAMGADVCLLDKAEQAKHKEDHDKGDDDPNNSAWSAHVHGILQYDYVKASSIH
jgi:hypothetical protein